VTIPAWQHDQLQPQVGGGRRVPTRAGSPAVPERRPDVDRAVVASMTGERRPLGQL